MLNDIEKSELENYFANRFIKQHNLEDSNDDFLAQWQEWINIIPLRSAGEILNENICRKRPVQFKSPESITIEIYNSVAGKVPVIVFGSAIDFENFIVNLIHKGERPDNISQTGASFIYGKTQRFLVLSKKYYSNTEPDFVGLSSEEWREKSMILRREHECTHYYTKRFYGSASNSLHDELIADFCGMYEAFGRYEAGLFRHFMGIDGTRGGRLSVYTAGLSEGVREVVAETACRCADALEAWSESESFRNMDKASRINHLCETDIKEMSNNKI